MSISDNYIPVKQQGDGTTEEFTGNWKVFNEDYLRVYLEAVSTGALVLQVQGTDYDLTFDDSGFIVDFGAYTIPTSSSYVVINREVPLNQTDPYRTSKGFQGEVIENAFDKLTAISQDQQDQVDRSPKFPVGSSITDPSLPIPQNGFGIVWDGVTGALRNTESTLAVLEGNASTVAGDIANINIVAGSISNVNSVASNEANINTVGGSISSVNTVAGISSNVSTVASNDANITTCADDIAAIIAAPSAASDAQAALAATLAAFDNFDDRYLGAKSSDPTVDNDGDPLVAGAIYFNTTDGIMKVYTGSVWVAAYVSGTDFLAKSNNLSDVSSASASRGNLGLGDLAVENTISNQDWSGEDLSCGNGGTGRSSHTPYGVICGGTTTQGAHQSVSDIGTAGQVLTSNGAGALPTMQDAGSGKIVKVAVETLASYSTTTTNIPVDNTIPQSTEGAELMTLAYTPEDPLNILSIEFIAPFTDGGGGVTYVFALFKDSDASAVIAGASRSNGGIGAASFILPYEEVAGSGARTYKIRFGGTQSQTIAVGGQSNGARFSTVPKAYLRITERTS